MIELTINGKTINASPQVSVIQALIESGETEVINAGCLNGVCGSCCVFVKYADSRNIETELGCQLIVQNGMQVSFIPDYFSTPVTLQLQSQKTLSEIPHLISEFFPQVEACRECGGCTNSCPKDIDVEHFIQQVIAAEYKQADELMESCVMCDLCESACPEKIKPQHLGVHLRKLLVKAAPVPANLINSINAIKSQTINTDI